MRTEPHHRFACTDPTNLTSRHSAQGIVVTCTACAGFWLRPDTDQDAAALPTRPTTRTRPTTPTQPTTPTTSRLVCREHHLPVNANGKGCTGCQKVQHAHQAKVRARQATAAERVVSKKSNALRKAAG